MTTNNWEKEFDEMERNHGWIPEHKDRIKSFITSLVSQATKEALTCKYCNLENYAITVCSRCIPNPSYSQASVDEAVKKAVEGERCKMADFIMPKVQKFIDKVESGRARSRETYHDMKCIREFLGYGQSCDAEKNGVKCRPPCKYCYGGETIVPSHPHSKTIKEALEMFD